MALIERARDGVIVRVKAKPNARREGVLGIVNEQLVVAVRTTAERGKANEAIVEVLAKWLEMPKSSFEIVSGAGARYKRILVSKVDESQVRARIAERLHGSG